MSKRSEIRSYASESHRDESGRSFGCVSVSVLAHAGLLALLIIAPKASMTPDFGQANGTGGQTDYVDFESPGKADPKDGATVSDGPSEILLAKADDVDAPVLPQAAPVPAPPPAPLPKEEPKHEVKAEIPAEKPKEVAPMKAAVRPKVQASILPPFKKAAAKNADLSPITQDDSDIKAALQRARTEPVQKDESFIPKKEVVKNEAAPEASKAVPEVADQPEAKPEAKAESKTEATEEVAAQPLAAVPSAPPKSARVEEAPKAAPENPSEDKSEATSGTTSGSTSGPTQASASQATASSTATEGAATQPGANGSGRGGGAESAASRGNGIPQGTQIKEASELIQRPGNRPPPYPQQDRLLARQGVTVVIGQVRADGSVGDVYLADSSGSSLMDQAAMKAFKAWKYKPGQEGYVRQPFKFQLTGDAQEMPARLRGR